MTVDEIAGLLQKWEQFGVRRFPSGTTYFGPIQNGARPRGWLHQIFRPLDPQILNDFEQQYPFQSKYSYPKAFFKFNGAILFLKSFFLYGLHTDANLEGTDLPWDYVIANIEKRRTAALFDGIVIGGADFGIREIDYIENSKNEIVAFDSKHKIVVHRWQNFDVFFKSEIVRLNSIFGSDGLPPKDFETFEYS